MQQFALVTGINEYANIFPLAFSHAESDAAALGRFLQQRCGFDEVVCLRGAEATTAGVFHAIQEASLQLKPDDVFLFYFAGQEYNSPHHGRLLLLHDVAPGSLPDNPTNVLCVRHLATHLDSLACRTVVILDLMHTHLGSGSNDRGETLPPDFVHDVEYLMKQVRPDAFQLMGLCSSNETAMALSGERTGAFLQAFMESVDIRLSGNHNLLLDAPFIDDATEALHALLRRHTIATPYPHPWFAGNPTHLTRATPDDASPAFRNSALSATVPEQESGPAPGALQQVRLDDQTTLDLVWIPPGEFIMGSGETEIGRSEDESQHPVTLSRGFWMGRAPVTQEQWQHIMGTNPAHFLGHDQYPVESVTWHDCQTFLHYLNLQCPGAAFRLSTEAEWEYACRAGTTTPFHYGMDITKKQVNYDNRKPTPTGLFAPNDWGLYDMHGNVWEWCQDWYGPYPLQVATDPTGAPAGTTRVLRGGSWLSDEVSCRAAARGNRYPGYRHYRYGLRVVQDG